MLEETWEDGSLKFWLASFGELFSDAEVSEQVSEFVREKMRSRLKDQRLCDILIPKDYGFGTHRVPLENGFLEAFLRPNVEVVSVKDNPIECVTPNGLQLTDGTEHAFDVLIFATGFDAGTGALTRIDIRGRGGRLLKDDWGREIRTTMGLQVHGYPNLFTTAAPLAPSAALCNMTTCLQQQAEWISDCIRYMRDHDLMVCEPTREAEDQWIEHHEADRRRNAGDQDQLLVHGVQRGGQAAAPAVLHRRRRGLPAEVRRSRGQDYEGFAFAA